MTHARIEEQKLFVLETKYGSTENIDQEETMKRLQSCFQNLKETLQKAMDIIQGKKPSFILKINDEKIYTMNLTSDQVLEMIFLLINKYLEELKLYSQHYFLIKRVLNAETKEHFDSIFLQLFNHVALPFNDVLEKSNIKNESKEMAKDIVNKIKMECMERCPQLNQIKPVIPEVSSEKIDTPPSRQMMF